MPAESARPKDAQEDRADGATAHGEADSGGETCRAVTVQPGEKGSGRLDRIAVGRPGPGQVLLRVLRVGICGTDAEIDAGLYGAPPPGHTRLVLGHESQVRVEAVGPDARGLQPGQLAVAIVRRPCPGPCPPCANGRWDLCVTGEYRERGIMHLDGFLRERLVEDAAFVVPVPEELEAVSVLLEPLSVVEKAIAEAERVRDPAAPPARRALVTGGGPIGLLAGLALRQRGLEVWLLDRRGPESPKGRLAAAAGMRYVDDSATPIERVADVGRFDLAVEATGFAPLVFRSLALLGRNGTLVLTGVTSGHRTVAVDANAVNASMVLENQVMIGSVNAARRHYEQAIHDLGDWRARWPGLAERMITARYPLERFRDALAPSSEDIKRVVEVTVG